MYSVYMEAMYVVCLDWIGLDCYMCFAVVVVVVVVSGSTAYIQIPVRSTSVYILYLHTEYI